MSDENLTVNEHFLGHVVQASRTSTVEATEDIFSGQGMKLLAKGARIDENTRDRLLQHKLLKPLEVCVRVVSEQGSKLSPPDLQGRAQRMLEQHALLEAFCQRNGARELLAELGQLELSTPAQALLSVYASRAGGKLDHALGVGMMAAAAMRSLPGTGGALAGRMLLAGLLHDIGELYLDPDLLQGGVRLGPEQWRHIAAHPVIGARVLRGLPGAGPQVADAVLYHHERLDGFGYPHGLRGDAVPVQGQALALAEMLMALIESGRAPGERASIAVKLIPGEFHRALADRVVSAARACRSWDEAERQLTPGPTAEDLLQRTGGLLVAMNRLRMMRTVVQAGAGDGSAALRDLVAHLIERFERIRQAISSTGLDAHDPAAMATLLAQLQAMEPAVLAEMAIVLREVEWRLREVRRETRYRLARLPSHEAALVSSWLDEARRQTANN